MNKRIESAECESSELATLGWREWVSLPDLGIMKIKAKVDTGARTSALHAYYVEQYMKDGESRVRFDLHPIQGDDLTHIHADARLLDERQVTDSGGHKESRYVIETRMLIGAHEHLIEMTLTNRDTMKFRMLVGRTALRGKYTVDSSRSFVLGEPVI
ncbi:MAG: RimK/LysX family protein [Agarilytica sp.]